MMEKKVISMCPKCSSEDQFSSQTSKICWLDGQRYELHTCPICGEQYLAHTFGYYSILRFHGDTFEEQVASILEITPSHCHSFIQLVNECSGKESLTKVVKNMHGDTVEPLTNDEYEKMLDTSIMLTEDIKEKVQLENMDDYM